MASRTRPRGIAPRWARLLVLLPVLAAGVVLAGCTTTRHEAQRMQLDSARQRAALTRTRITVANPRVRAAGVQAVAGAGATALIVTVENTRARAVTDLPISVGYLTRTGARVYLNDADDLDYFQAHLPAIGAHGSLRWVYTVARTLPAGARLFALVGRRQAAPARLTETNVKLGVSYDYTAGSGSVIVHVDNPTSVPQYELQVYAYARTGGRYVAAGARTVTDLGAGTRQRVKLSLIGSGAQRLSVEAIPTILQ